MKAETRDKETGEGSRPREKDERTPSGSEKIVCQCLSKRVEGGQYNFLFRLWDRYVNQYGRDISPLSPHIQMKLRLAISCAAESAIDWHITRMKELPEGSRRQWHLEELKKIENDYRLSQNMRDTIPIKLRENGRDLKKEFDSAIKSKKPNRFGNLASRASRYTGRAALTLAKAAIL